MWWHDTFSGKLRISFPTIYSIKHDCQFYFSIIKYGRRYVYFYNKIAVWIGPTGHYICWMVFTSQLKRKQNTISDWVGFWNYGNQFVQCTEGPVENLHRFYRLSADFMNDYEDGHSHERVSTADWPWCIMLVPVDHFPQWIWAPHPPIPPWPDPTGSGNAPNEISPSINCRFPNADEAMQHLTMAVLISVLTTTTITFPRAPFATYPIMMNYLHVS